MLLARFLNYDGRYQLMRQLLKHTVAVGLSSIHGRGLFLLRPVLQHQMLIEYTGELIRFRCTLSPNTIASVCSPLPPSDHRWLTSARSTTCRWSGWTASTSSEWMTVGSWTRPRCVFG